VSIPLEIVEQFMVLCAKHGVVKARYQDVEIDFGRPAGGRPVPREMEGFAAALAAGALSDEQALFGSAGQPVGPAEMEALLKRFTTGG
jgi:hypothetical protein